MADKSGKDEEKFAWDADLHAKNSSADDPSESSTTYKLASPSPMRPAAVEPVTRVPVVEPVGPRRVATKNSGGWFVLAGYNFLIFITSVCVMTLELTASRIIGKHLGASLYTWTSVIGVILAGITLGNWLGGWLADRFERHRALAWMYLLSSIFSASVLLMEQLVHVLERPASVSWPMWVLAVVALLFLLPALAIGATSPLIASLAIARSNRIGATVGNVYAWGAGGSIVGTFLTGFYLSDVYGSRSIIAFVSGTLAILAIAVAGQRAVFRAAVAFGWLQLFLFLWASASATGDSWSNVAAAVADGTGYIVSDETGLRRAHWLQFGQNVGQKMHEMGLVLGVRDDEIGRYSDESQYSYIQVTDGREDGAPVKVLRLDKLIHSYYNPATPTALHYDYEKIYAAVTKVAAVQQDDTSAVTVPDFPGWSDIRTKLPASVQFDETNRQLTAARVDSHVVERLLELSPDADYWYAVEQLSIITTQAGWGGLEAHTLDRLPDGVTLPADLAEIVRYDESLRLMTAYEPVTPAIRDRLIQASPRAPWYVAVNALRQQSGKINSFFIGGGGYIFPRWLAAEYPGSKRIDVAELDPAVREAVVAELGMTPQDEALIHTTTGDARHVVDEHLRENRRRRERGEEPITYDFIFGDAFNDFSVPWHLTTLEFQQKLKEMLSPHGVVQVNLIDVYPRAEFPGRPLSQGEVHYQNFLPAGLVKGTDYPSNQWIPTLSKFGKIEINCRAAGDFQIRATQELSDYQRKLLVNLDRSNEAWRSAVYQLANQTKRSEPYSGTVPAALIPEQLSRYSWVTATDQAVSLELQETDSGQFVLGYRGVMSDAERDRLIALSPQDASWKEALTELQKRSLKEPAGQFLGRFVYTAAQIFPNVYLFSTSTNQVGVSRDTFVIVCSLAPLDLKRLDKTGFWSGKPFAMLETRGEAATVQTSGQMDSVLAMARGQMLTDDFAPVENLLLPIFAGQ